MKEMQTKTLGGHEAIADLLLTCIAQEVAEHL